MKNLIQQLIDEQLQDWELAKSNYAALENIQTKDLDLNGHIYKVQFNPTRIASSAAKVDKQSLQARKCFLCSSNLPPQQKGIPFMDKYQILLNPFPIFPKHLTIPNINHTDQLIGGGFEDMLNLAEVIDDYVIFYNGPKCGASAPDHAHFQAGSKGFLPLEKDFNSYAKEPVVELANASLSKLTDEHRSILVIESTQKQAIINLFKMVYDAMDVKEGEAEPMMNLLAWKDKCKWIVCIIIRAKHRPDCFQAEGEKNLLVSPASVDMGGVIITPLEKDFEKITKENIADILKEVSLSAKQCNDLIHRIKLRV